MINFKRRNTLWLAALSVLMTLVLISGNLSADAQALLFGVFVLALVGSFVDVSALMDRQRLIETIQQPLSRSRMSPQAREAVDRASGRLGYREPDVQLSDIGLIVSHSSREGTTFRRVRTISKDDDGVRPFVTLLVEPEEADRNAVIRYEIIDQNGQEQYVYEMTVYLRDGEMNILADTHLPLRKNSNIAGMGDWDLRVLVDGKLAAVHNFSLTASSAERRQRIGGQYYVTNNEAPESRERLQARDDDDDDDDDDNDIPMSLEDLLRSQKSR